MDNEIIQAEKYLMELWLARFTNGIAEMDAIRLVNGRIMVNPQNYANWKQMYGNDDPHRTNRDRPDH